jgi:hypothetical protein
LREIPTLTREAAAELLKYDTAQAARIIRALGIGRLDTFQQVLVADFLAKWDEQLQTSKSTVITLAHVAGIGGQGTDAWRRWVETCPPDELGVRLARMLEKCRVNETSLPNSDELRAVLAHRGDVRDWRVGQARTAQRKLVRGDEMERLTDLILDSFERHDLEVLMRYKLDIRLNDIVSSKISFRETVFEILTWADRHGVTELLIRSMADARPHRLDLQQVLGELFPTAAASNRNSR